MKLGGGAGALQKSLSTNAFSYKGEDPTQYVNDFSQLSAVGSVDLSPVIKTLRWLENADDEKFDGELTDWVDVEAFALCRDTRTAEQFWRAGFSASSATRRFSG